MCYIDQLYFTTNERKYSADYQNNGTQKWRQEQSFVPRNISDATEPEAVSQDALEG